MNTPLLVETAHSAEPGDDRYAQPLRPQLHFSSPENWINDPNGMVRYRGRYHLCYQYNPSGVDWGNMHWGHASSEDLLHWQHHDVAIPADPEGLGFAFSGCAVIDTHNSSGLGSVEEPPMVAMYTNSTIRGEQAQSLYYSLDEGESWIPYHANPVLPNPGRRDFRDPKIFWFAAHKVWVMSLATGDGVWFYRSENLINWHFASGFDAPDHCSDGVWECPDLFQLETASGLSRWVLLVSISTEHSDRHAAVQYFLGDFDGYSFVPDNTENRWLDNGPDNYGAVSWEGDDAVKGQRTIIGWMSNWRSGRAAPTYPWRGHMTLPRVLTLVEDQDALSIASRPAVTLKRLASQHQRWAGTVETGPLLNGKLEGINASELLIDLTVRPSGNEPLRICLANDGAERLEISLDSLRGRIQLDRTGIGRHLADPHNQAIVEAPLRKAGRSYDMTVVIDRCCVELFVDGGRSVISANFFPLEALTKLSMHGDRHHITGEVVALRGVWRNP